MTAANGEPLLEARGLHCFYGLSHVLQGVDLRLEPAQAVSLMGRNGMGKTTTLRTLVGLLRPRRGQVMIDGRDVTGASPDRIARSGVALVPEGRGIFPNLTVEEHLRLAARPARNGGRGWTLERVLDLFPRLAERRAHWGNQLSGGEQQMLAIGRALLTNPRVLLLDEATEGLAPLIRAEIWRVLETVKASGIACVIVDKNVNQLLDIADRHVILAKGRVVFAGDRAALLADPELLHRHLGV